MPEVTIPKKYSKNRLIVNSSPSEQSDILQWIKYFGMNPTLKAVLEHKEKIREYIENEYGNHNTKAHHLQTLTAMLKRGKCKKAERMELVQEYKQEKEQYMEEKKDNEPSEDYLDYDSICKIRDVYKNHDHFKYLILSLYTYWPPIRSEWFDMEIGYSETENCIYKNENENWILRIHHDKLINKKNKKEPVEFNLSDPLVKKITNENIHAILEKSILDYPRKLVIPICSTTDLPMGKYHQHFLHHIFGGKKIGINILRQAFVSKLHGLDLTSNERDHISKLMRHSTLIADQIYNKIGSTDKLAEEIIQLITPTPPKLKTGTKQKYVDKNRDKIYVKKILKHCNTHKVSPKYVSIEKYGLVHLNGQWVQQNPIS